MTRRIVIAFDTGRQAEAAYRASTGISAAIIDLRRLFPLEEEAIVNSIKKTKHLGSPIRPSGVVAPNSALP